LENSLLKKIRSESTILFLIAIYKFVKGLVLALIGAELIAFTPERFIEVLEEAMKLVNINPANAVASWVIMKMSIIDSTLITEISLVILLYAIVSLIEGTGLFFRQTWAEYLSIIITGSPIPFEFYEIFKGITWPKLLITAVNISIVAFLANRHRNRRILAVKQKKGNQVEPDINDQAENYSSQP
jgi:uncharacterized membrane protein (DUF2068 family)